MGGRYPAQKLLVVVDRGAIATVVVALKDRARVGLLYQPAVADPPYRITQGTSAVEFEACHSSTQFNGGFIVAGPRCVQLDVHHNGKLTRAWIPFGTGRQPCPPGLTPGLTVSALSRCWAPQPPSTQQRYGAESGRRGVDRPGNAVRTTPSEARVLEFDSKRHSRTGRICLTRLLPLRACGTVADGLARREPAVKAAGEWSVVGA